MALDVNIERFRNLVIGCGEAGKYLAWNLAKMGQATALVERSMVGGSCPNIACLPSKNVIYSAKAVSLVDRENGLGVVAGPYQVDMSGVARRKRAMVDGLIDLHLANFKASGAQLIMGEAKFTAPKTVLVALKEGGSRVLFGDRVFLSLGSRASVPDVPGLVAAHPMTHVEALDLERLPEHIVILGGGYIGLEFAQAMHRFGSRVTIVQRGPRLLDREDPDVSDALLELMKDEGIEVRLQAEVLSVIGRSGNSVDLRVRTGEKESNIKASDILVAAGRAPNTDKIDLAAAEVKLDSRGYIQVDERLQTSASGCLGSWGLRGQSAVYARCVR